MAADYAAAEVIWSGGTTTLLGLTKILSGIAENDTSQDEVLALYLDMAGTACEQYIDNKIVAQDVTELFAKSRSPVDLRYWPVGDLTNVTIDGVDVTADFEAYTSDGIQWQAKESSGSSCSTGFEQMSITYSAGFDPVPSDLGFVLARTSMAYSNQAGGVGAVKKESVVGVGSIEYQTDEDSEGSSGFISSASVSVLEQYRRYRV